MEKVPNIFFIQSIQSDFICYACFGFVNKQLIFANEIAAPGSEGAFKHEMCNVIILMILTGVGLIQSNGVILASLLPLEYYKK